MATGTGKTKTALSASVRLFEREKRLAVIITVPYQHLIDQWNTESQEFGYRPILAYQSKISWFDKLNNVVMDYSAGYREHFSVVTPHPH
jgi:superfamily II DNA or RNA helicase